MCGLGWTPPRPSPPLSFTFPALADPAADRIAAISFVGPTTDLKNVRVAGEGYINSSTTASLYLSSSATDEAAADPNCTTPFRGGETAGRLDVVVTPDTVKTCVISFVVYADKNGDGKPNDGEVSTPHMTSTATSARPSPTATAPIRRAT